MTKIIKARIIKKKAIFYTTAAIALTIVIIATYSIHGSYKFSDRMEVIQTRIETMNFFIKDVEKDIDKGIFIAGFRSLLSFNQFIATNGTFLDSVSERFKESFLNGTISQKPLSLMKDSTFTDWANKISAEADKIDIKFNFTVNVVKLNQTDPWSVIIGVNITLDIRDKRNTSYWIRDRYLENTISIIGFEDPLYVVNSKGRVTNSIRESNITSFVVNGKADNLLVHANNSYYIAHNDSPNFLMRLEGNLGNSTFGIESLVNLEKFQQQGLQLKDRSIVDYIYFGTKATTNFRVNNTPDWFKIDGDPPAPGPPRGDHLDIYQVRNITI
ncbi:hypothetical protein HYY70_05500 [Candidatus Woesearchaeota archaeon]|nr:hypothetical protein [Candidatus Woesearchaeota archaeon]